MGAELADSSTGGKGLVAKDCGHHIHVEQTPLVIDAIQDTRKIVGGERL